MPRSIHTILVTMGVIAGMMFGAVPAMTQDLQPISLPAPQREGGKPLMECLDNRMSTRVFSPRELSPQVLSNLLWAASGINRPDGRMTAPTAVNYQELDIYVSLNAGVYRYDRAVNTLEPVLAGNHQAAAGAQPFVATAPLNLIYVADYTKMGNGTDEQKQTYAAYDTGFVSQNVYLFCASEGLVTVVRAMVDGPALAALLGFGDNLHVTLCQTVGYPE